MSGQDICGIPTCRGVAQDQHPLCDEHLDAGYLEDYQLYCELIVEGSHRRGAIEASGLQAAIDMVSTEPA